VLRPGSKAFSLISGRLEMHSGQPRLLGGLRLAGGDGGLHLIEADLDQVVVGLVAGLLPRRREGLVDQGAGAAVGVLDRLQRHDLVALVGVVEVGGDLVEDRFEIGQALRVEPLELG